MAASAGTPSSHYTPRVRCPPMHSSPLDHQTVRLPPGPQPGAAQRVRRGTDDRLLSSVALSRSCIPRRLISCKYKMLELSANDPLIKTYLKDLQHLKSQSVTHELGLKGPFQNLLDKAAKRRGWTLVPELS